MVTEELIHSQVQHKGTEYEFSLILVYGFNDIKTRGGLWKEIDKLQS